MEEGSNNQVEGAAASMLRPSEKETEEKKPRIKFGKWTREEDAKLSMLVLSGNEPNDVRMPWSKIAQQMPNRTPKQCRERYVNILRPNTKKGQWTQKEDEQIMSLHAQLGNQWTKIAAVLPGRSDNDVKNRWNCKMNPRKRIRKHKTTTDKQRNKRSKPSERVCNVDSNEMEPKVMQRVQVEFRGGNLYSGTIIKVSERPKKTKQLFYNITIRYDNVGAIEETVYPDPTIHLIPAKKKRLPEKTVRLSHQLLQRKSDESVQDSKSVDEDHPFSEKEYHEDYLYEYLAEKSEEQSAIASYDDDDDHEATALKSAGGFSGGVAANMLQNNNASLINQSKSAGDFDESPMISTSLTSLSSSESDDETKGPWPMRGIKTPGDNDVLTGRGGMTNRHRGNIKFRTLAEDLKPDYKACKLSDKGAMVMKFLKDWRAQDPPGRFLKANEQTGLWEDIGDKGAREKCAQVLREKTAARLRLEPDGTSP